MKDTILIIDDEAPIVKVVGRQLIKAGYDVISALDGIQGTQVALKKQPSLIIMDINMPAGSGHVVAARLRENYKTCAIPIIVISGSGNQEDAEQAKAWGAIKYFGKPFDVRELIKAVKEVLSHEFTGNP